MGYPRHFSFLHAKVDAQCGSPDVGLSASHGIASHGCSVLYRGTASRHVKLPENVAVASLAHYHQARPENDAAEF